MLEAPLFLAPTTLGAAQEALELEGSMLLAGGTSTGILLKNGLIEPSRFVYLGHVDGLRDIEHLPMGAIRVGSMVTLRELHRSPIVREEAPSLAYAASRVGNPRVRALATVGGAIAHADPRQDLPPVLLALGAVVRVVGPRGEREIPVRDLFLGFLETALEEDEILVDVLIPAREGRREAYTRFTPNSDDDYPTVGVAVSLRVSSAGEITDAALALGGVDSRAILVADVAGVLVGSRGQGSDLARVAELASLVAEPTLDSRGSIEYKRSMIEVWTRRTLTACLAGFPF